MAETPTEPNPHKVRIGLAIVSLIFVASAILIAVADSVTGKAIFFAIAAMTLVRAALLARWLRKQQRSAA